MPRRRGKVSHPKGSANASPMGKEIQRRCSSQRLGHCLTDGERLVIPRARPLPRRWGKRPSPGRHSSQRLGRYLANGETFQKARDPEQGTSQELGHCLADGEQEDPEQRSSQRLGRCLTNGECVSKVKMETASSKEVTVNRRREMGRVCAVMRCIRQRPPVSTLPGIHQRRER